MSLLYIVATPIGNLGDVTYRAIETLKSVDTIACEDTRVSRRLLDHYGIKKRLISCRARNEKNSALGIVKLLERGESVAYLTDAGTPGVSDPGKSLVALVEHHGYQVTSLPGASAVTTIVSLSGSPSKSYLFEGFLPQKRGKRRERVKELLERPEPFVLYESPYRVVELLKLIDSLSPERTLFIGREMTKIHETFFRGNPAAAVDFLGEMAIIKGEFTLFVEGIK